MEKEVERIAQRLEDPRLTRPNDEADYEKMHADLQGLPFPAGTEYLYCWFLEIARGRQSDDGWPSALTATEIAAWRDLIGHRLTPWEFGMICRIDGKWREIFGELHKPDPPARKTTNN